jgi:SAM-dependent methyltransferase
MHPAVYRVFAEICAGADIRGPVLEVGAVPGPDCLLRLPELEHAHPKIGLNLDADQEGTPPGADYEIVRGNANDLSRFADGQFGAVLSNATLEHDRCFWKTVAEIRRVTASGGLVIIGVPGYAGMGLAAQVPRGSLFGWLLRRFRRGAYADMIEAGTVTLGVHLFPGDYYRFSEQAVREVFMEGITQVSVRTVLNPPRFIAWGRKP